MLSYVLKVPAFTSVDAVDSRIRKAYGDAAVHADTTAHASTLPVLDGSLQQNGSYTTRLKNVFVEMSELRLYQYQNQWA